MKRLAILYQLNKLTIESCLETKGRSRIEINDNYKVITLPLLSMKKKQNGEDINISQIKIVIINKTNTIKETSIIIIDHIVITIIDKKKHSLNLTKRKLNKQFSNIRNSSDFLLYHLIDEIVNILLIYRSIQQYPF